MIRQDLIRFIEKCDFEVLNKGDYDNIEIRDLKNNKILTRYSHSPQFDGKDGRNVNLQENCVEVGLNNEINLRKEGLEDFFVSYTIYVPYLKKFKADFKMLFLINYVNKLISITIVNYGETKEQTKLVIDIDNSDSKTYIQKIMDFLSENNSTLENKNIQEGIKIILPLAYEEVEKLISYYDKNEEKSKNIK